MCSRMMLCQTYCKVKGYMNTCMVSYTKMSNIARCQTYLKGLEGQGHEPVPDNSRKVDCFHPGGLSLLAVLALYLNVLCSLQHQAHQELAQVCKLPDGKRPCPCQENCLPTCAGDGVVWYRVGKVFVSRCSPRPNITPLAAIARATPNG